MKFNMRVFLKYVFMIIADFASVFLSAILSARIVSGADFLLENNMFYCFLAICSLILCIIFFGVHVYQCSLSHVGFFEISRTVFGCGIVTVIQFLVACVLATTIGKISFSYFGLFFVFASLFTSGSRCLKRSLVSAKHQLTALSSKGKIPVMVVGAGDAGATLINEIITSNKVNVHVKCIVDDDKAKVGTYLFNKKIEGTRDDIPELVKKYSIEEIYIAIPSASDDDISAVSEICKSTGKTVKILPGVYQLMSGKAFFGKLKEVSVEDLLNRKSVCIDLDKDIQYVHDKVVMVTGGGGSIGSELCRQIAKNVPHQLIIVDIYENNAYDIQQELRNKYPALNLEVLIASVRDEQRMEHIFKAYRPQIVFHAAAHKHVPLMEDSPNEAIKNNSFGTYKTAKLADKYGVKTFVLISTDKAVNPTNVMGASKRMCEMIIQSFAKISKTKFVAVRFGNVLGSNGSVIPLFKKQIAAGGPVLVTHPDIIRYFMTIPEAVSLVIQAGAYANGGEIFVLDMGKPVKILDMAEKMIRLSGYTPYKDIDIQFTGLRPGEKLYEEMLMDEEGLQETENKLIHIGKPIEMDEEHFFVKLKELKAVLDTEPDNARQLIKEMVPTYIGNADLKNI